MPQNAVMSKTFLDHHRTQAWLDQFRTEDRWGAAKLAASLRLVSADEFAAGLTQLLSDRLHAGEGPIALYNETERRFWRGRPNRLFKEPRQKVLRAVGVNGPSLVPRGRTVDQEVGSEGTVAAILTQFKRDHKKAVHLSPGPDTIRDRQIRRFVLVTDFIGSGKRALSYLDAAWRVRSVRSWWSRRNRAGLSFEVIAFCGTEEGIARIEAHTCEPRVTTAQYCPTIDTVFTPQEADKLKTLCRTYPTQTSKPEALGFCGTGALIAFAHSMPNNAPPLFWRRTGTWNPLFPSRVTMTVEAPFRAGTGPDALRNRFEAMSDQPMEPITIETQVLSALRRSPRSQAALSGRLGLPLDTISAALLELQRFGWINKNLHITERGRLALRRLAKPASPNFLSPSADDPYFPRSLRAPRGV